MVYIRSLFFVLLTGISLSSYSKTDSLYQSLISRASLLHLQKKIKPAIVLYERAFKIKQPEALAAYKAAGVYSLDSNAAKAFQYLAAAISSGWTEADWLTFDPYFDYLKARHSEAWKKVQQDALVSEERYAKTLHLPLLRKEINLMTVNDQKLRYARIQNNNDSSRKAIEEEIVKSDYNNLIRAKEIIKQYGWPKVSQIGKDGQNNLWLIVQHADQDVLFQKSALLAMQKLDRKERNMENYAFLYDRVQCNLNYKQLYGTQVFWSGNGQASGFRPMISEHTVDERRTKLGLQPLNIYALSYGFNYKAVTYAESKQKDFIYSTHVRNLIDSAKQSYRRKEFSKTYDYYNTASTFIGGMTNATMLEAALIFSRIAAVDADGKYKSIALDFLDLLHLRGSLTKRDLIREPAFKILSNDKRWVSINKDFSRSRHIKPSQP